MLGEFKIIQYRTRGGDTLFHPLHAESLQRFGAELLAEFVLIYIRREYPVVETVGVVSVAERRIEAILVSALVDDLLGGEIRQQLVHIEVVALRHVELARRYVEESHARGLGSEVDRSQKRVLLVGQHVVVAQHHARGNQLDHTSFHQTFDGLGVLQLLADGHALARPHEFGHVDVERMMRKSRQLYIRSGAVGPPRKRYAQNRTRLDGVVPESFIKISHTKQQYRIGMHRLDRVVLLHQGRLHVFLLYSHSPSFLREQRYK